ncbi:ROK family transcriptional regulator [Streptomyces uncialis]|uniref:ROK family transcriptional regulator n=1 Tax=Streptomyces uncialis TaxID=1048205 RepID=UPI002255C7EA|nr:ROK family transcriptional regulator [Streptomyces uncialis]MCX4664077.1 ROK family transcriptional regulator [Streptomyces uncialis]
MDTGYGTGSGEDDREDDRDGEDRAAGPRHALAGAGGGGGGANLPVLRGHNTALLLGLLRTAGPDGTGRRELAAASGLTPQAISKITARLRTEGLVAETARRPSTGGKPSTPLRLVPGAAHAVGVHMERDGLTAVLVDLYGTVVAERRTPLDLGAGTEAVLDAVTDTVTALRARLAPAAAAPLGAGVALPGPLDHRTGVPRRITGFPEWDGFPLRTALRRRLGTPVVVGKDTDAAALGLALAGADGTSFAYLHLGTGLGAGLVLDGRVLRGAGEFGHQVVQLDGPPCGCGDRGCLEAVCLAALARGDTAGAARVLGTGAANLAGLLGVRAVVLGGRAVRDAPGVYVRGVREALGARAARTGDPDDVPVRTVPGGDRLVAEGAAQLLLAPLFGRGG